MLIALSLLENIAQRRAVSAPPCRATESGRGGAAKTALIPAVGNTAAARHHGNSLLIKLKSSRRGSAVEIDGSASEPLAGR